MSESSNQSWTATVQEDEHGELFIVFPEDLVQQLAWKDGDTVVWNIREDGSITVTKQ